MKVRKTILPVLVLLIAMGLTFVIVKSRKVPKPQETPYLGPLVDVAELQPVSRKVVVTATGSVQAKHEVNITPQVRGKVVYVSPDLIAGGHVKKGELLFSIEDIDYRLAIDLAKANLAKAELELQRNESLAKVARQEWQALNPDNHDPDPLVVYEPQIKSAMAQRDAAVANVEQAEINLQRTQVFAPLNGYVRSEQVEVGQYLNVGSPVTTLVGTDQAEVIVPLPLDELAWIKVPAEGENSRGSTAEVVLNSGNHSFKWTGAVTRTMGEIDPRNRMAKIVVTIDDPVVTTSTKNPLSRLLPGMFVEVNLQGEDIAQVFAVPRGALHDDDTVWIADDENKLRIRNVEIVRRERDEVLVLSGINAGEKIILTNLSAAAEGMVLRPQVLEVGQ